jgi:ligand-binding sensor domain-containing protein
MSDFSKLSGLILFSVLSGILFFSCENDKTDQGTKFPANRVMSIFVDPSGIVWAGTDVGIISYSEGVWTSYKSIKNLPAGNVYEIEFHDDNISSEIWLATSNGAIAANYALGVITSATVYTSELSGLLDNRINDIKVNAQGERWFATATGLSVSRENKWYSETAWGDLVSNQAISLDSRNDGWIFAGTVGLGVARFKFDESIDGITGASYYNTDWSGLRSDTILCIYVDKDGHQWFGTTQGVAYHTDWETKIGWEAFSVEDGLINNHVQAVAEDSNGLIWFGTANGVSSFDGEKWKSYSTSDGLINPSVNDIAIGEDGTVWFATNGGVSAFNGVSWKNFSR